VFIHISGGLNSVEGRYLQTIRYAKSRSQWPCGLRRLSAAARLLGLRVPISPGHGCLSLVSVVCCQVEVSASGLSLVQRSPTICGVSECDREVSILRRPWPSKGCRAMGVGGTYAKSMVECQGSRS
jgi:hypothetical protein